MSRLAVDVVLLPDEALFAKIVAINRRWLGQRPQHIILDPVKSLPHVSLAMGCVEEEAVPAISRLLDGVAAGRRPVALMVRGLHVRTNAAGDDVWSLDLEPTLELRGLHDQVMDLIGPHFTHDVTASMFVEPSAVTGRTMEWVKTYPITASGDRFWPHITLGMGRLPPDLVYPAGGLAPRLALCHLGPHCTCRRLVLDHPLSG